MITFHRHAFKAQSIWSWKPWGYTRYGYKVNLVCKCGASKRKIVGLDKWDYPDGAEWPDRAIPTLAEYNKGLTSNRDIHMKTAAIVVAAIGIFFLMLGGMLMGNYNGFVAAKTKVDKAWGTVEVSYQRRFDLIGNLVESVKGAQGQEQKVFGDIAAARTRYAGTTSSSDKAAAAGNMESALARLLVINEAYPDLKSNAQVQSLMTQLAGTEDGISAGRIGYNDAATNYNLSISRFPANFLAKMFGFSKQELFKAEVGAATVPKVKF